MAGEPGALNLATFFFDTNAVVIRQAEVPDADFVDGANPNASCANGIGFGSGVVNFKEQDYPIPDPNEIQRSSYIGFQSIPGVVLPTAISVGFGAEGDPPTGPNSLITPVTAAGVVAPQGIVESVGGFDFTNQTIEDLEAGDRVFGVAANP